MKKAFAPELVTAFVELDGMTTAVLGNESDTLTPDGIRKAAGFVRFADAFGLPVLTLSKGVRLEATEETEKAFGKEAAAFVSTLASATVPKLNVVIGDLIGNAYLLMNPKATGADVVYALEGVKIGIMDKDAAKKILSDDAVISRFEAEQAVSKVAKRGYVDEIVSASSLRKKVLLAMEILSAKRETPIVKKHAGK